MVTFLSKTPNMWNHYCEDQTIVFEANCRLESELCSSAILPVVHSQTLSLSGKVQHPRSCLYKISLGWDGGRELLFEIEV